MMQANPENTNPITEEKNQLPVPARRHIKGASKPERGHRNRSRLTEIDEKQSLRIFVRLNRAERLLTKSLGKEVSLICKDGGYEIFVSELEKTFVIKHLKRIFKDDAVSVSEENPSHLILPYTLQHIICKLERFHSFSACLPSTAFIELTAETLDSLESDEKPLSTEEAAVQILGLKSRNLLTFSWCPGFCTLHIKQKVREDGQIKEVNDEEALIESFKQLKILGFDVVLQREPVPVIEFLHSSYEETREKIEFLSRHQKMIKQTEASLRHLIVNKISEDNILNFDPGTVCLSRGAFYIRLAVLHGAMPCKLHLCIENSENPFRGLENPLDEVNLILFEKFKSILESFDFGQVSLSSDLSEQPISMQLEKNIFEIAEITDEFNVSKQSLQLRESEVTRGRLAYFNRYSEKKRSRSAPRFGFHLQEKESSSRASDLGEKPFLPLFSRR